MALNPFNVVQHQEVVQSDTIQSITRKIYLGVPVPLYRFRQSSRLTSKPLPFQIVLVNRLDQSGVLTIPVPMTQAADSWFPEYYWSIVVCESCGTMKHLGWKFTHKIDHSK